MWRSCDTTQARRDALEWLLLERRCCRFYRWNWGSSRRRNNVDALRRRSGVKAFLTAAGLRASPARA
jgi:hypothetical protein